MAEQPPQDDEDDDAGASTSACQFSRAVASGDASQQLAHVVIPAPCGLLPSQRDLASGDYRRTHSERTSRGTQGFQRYTRRITLRPAAGRRRAGQL